jgi:hypothetical protein
MAAMNMIFRPIERQDYGQVRQLLIDTGWQQRVGNQNRFERMIEGAGRTIVAAVDDPEKITWVLRAGRGSVPFWEKMGFRKSETAMEIVRKG